MQSMAVPSKVFPSLPVVPSSASETGWTRLDVASTCIRQYLARYPGDPEPWKRYEVEVDLERFAPYVGRERSTGLPAPGSFDMSEAAAFGSLVHLAVAEHYGGESAIAALPPATRNHPLWLRAQATSQSVIRWQALESRGYSVMPGSVEASLWSPDPVHAQRVDLCVVDRRDRVWIVDHKTSKRPMSPEDRAISGQFHLYAWLGELNWGARFGGVLVQEIEVDKDYRFKSTSLLPLTDFETDGLEAFIRAQHAKVEADLNGARSYPLFDKRVCCAWGRPCSELENCYSSRVDFDQMRDSAPGRGSFPR